MKSAYKMALKGKGSLLENQDDVLTHSLIKTLGEKSNWNKFLLENKISKILELVFFFFF